MTKLTKNQIKVKFPTLAKVITDKYFDSVEIEGEVCFVDEIGDHVLTFPEPCLGKVITITKDCDNNAYEAYSGDNMFPEFCAFSIRKDEMSYFHKIVALVEGNFLEDPVIYEGDILEYNKDLKEFSCGCVKFNSDLAEQIFKFIGKNLGYEITN